LNNGEGSQFHYYGRETKDFWINLPPEEETRGIQKKASLVLEAGAGLMQCQTTEKGEGAFALLGFLAEGGTPSLEKGRILSARGDCSSQSGFKLKKGEITSNTNEKKKGWRTGFIFSSREV